MILQCILNTSFHKHGLCLFPQEVINMHFPLPCMQTVPFYMFLGFRIQEPFTLRLRAILIVPVLQLFTVYMWVGGCVGVFTKYEEGDKLAIKCFKSPYSKQLEVF